MKTKVWFILYTCDIDDDDATWKIHTTLLHSCSWNWCLTFVDPGKIPNPIFAQKFAFKTHAVSAKREERVNNNNIELVWNWTCKFVCLSIFHAVLLPTNHNWVQIFMNSMVRCSRSQILTFKISLESVELLICIKRVGNSISTTC
jgi:hypothetical protein